MRKRSIISKGRLDALLEEATVDCYGESEQIVGIFTMLEENLQLPFETMVLGSRVTITRVDLTDNEQIVAVCLRGPDRQRIPIVDLPLPSPPPAGAEWIETYSALAASSMSEYEYYEFVAIDRPLTQSEMRELRSFSTRARITPTSFVNDYSWGGFKGDEDAWMEMYFDAFLYLTNWGSRTLKLRLPARLLDLKTADLYCVGDHAHARLSDGKVVLTFFSDDEEDDEWTEGEGTLSSLISILWTEIDSLIVTRQPNGYDQAVKLLVDLRDVAVRGDETGFRQRLERLRSEHARKPTLIKRMGAAGL